MKKFFIIAGEASGDLLGAKLIAELKRQNPQSSFIGVGGRLMKEQGLESIFPMEDLSVMGFLEVLPHLPKLINRINYTVEEIIRQQPDCVVTIDSPDFCFRVIKKIKHEKNIKKIHLIAPSVWAYREGRAQKISKLYDLLLAILPFEPPYFEKYGLKTVFIGHPITENAPDISQKYNISQKFRLENKIKNDEIVFYVTPGSRNGEVKKIFPEFITALNLLYGQQKNIKVVIPLVDKTKDLVTRMASDLKMNYIFCEKHDKEKALMSSDFALAKSGTNTLEISLYQIPMVIAYKINVITHFILCLMVKIKYANLVNLVLNEEIIPEMLQDKCQSQKIFELLNQMIGNKKLCQDQVIKSQTALKIMGLGFERNPSQKAAAEILKL